MRSTSRAWNFSIMPPPTMRTLASLCSRAMRAPIASLTSAARTAGNLLATIVIPMPFVHRRMPRWASPRPMRSATARAQSNSQPRPRPSSPRSTTSSPRSRRYATSAIFSSTPPWSAPVTIMGFLDPVGRFERSRVRPPRLFCDPFATCRLFVALDVVDHVLHGTDLLCLLVRDFHVVLLFERHHQLDDVEGVRPQILDEGGFRRDFFLAHAELLTDDLLHLLLHGRCHDALLALAQPRGSHVEPAVDVQDVAGDVARRRGCQKSDRGGNLLGSSNPSGRNDVRVEGPLLLAERGRHVGLDEPRCDGVHGDSPRRDLTGERFR